MSPNVAHAEIFKRLFASSSTPPPPPPTTNTSGTEMALPQDSIKTINESIDKLEGDKNLKEAIKKTVLMEVERTTTNQRLKEKLGILFEYEKNCLSLIKEFKEEIKFIGSLQEDIRKERSKFFAENLREVSTTLKEAQITNDVASKWIEELVTSYTKSLDVSASLVDEKTFDTIGEIRNQAKNTAAVVKNLKMTHSDLISALAFLQAGRQELVSDFANESPDLYGAILESTKSPAILDLAKSRYFLGWLNGHGNNSEAICSDSTLLAFKKLCGIFNNVNSDLNLSAELKHFISGSINEKISFIAGLLEIDKQDDARIINLKYHSKKMTHFYNIEFEKHKNVTP